MSITATQEQHGLLRAIEGLRSGRAIAFLGVGWLLAVGLSMLGGATRSYWGVLLFALLGMLVMLYALCAAGIVLLDLARGMSPPSLADACFAAIPAFVKFLLILGIGIVCFLLYWVLLAALFLVCKIPGIGPVLYALLLPVTIVLTATVMAGAYIALGLLGPAVWEGHTIGGAIARLFAIATQRPVECLVHFVLLSLLVALSAWMIFGLLVLATLSTGGISATVLDVDPSMAFMNLPGLLAYPGGGGGYSDGYFSAALFGIALVFGIASAAILSMQILGCNLIYLKMSEGIDSSAAEAKLREGLAQAKRKAEELQATARERTQQMQERARQHAEQRAAQNAQNTAAPPATKVCPACGAANASNDTFCGECGAKV